MEKLIGVLIVFVLLAVMAISGEGDYEQEQAEAQHYCDMVRSGYWPNFKEIDCLDKVAAR